MVATRSFFTKFLTFAGSMKPESGRHLSIAGVEIASIGSRRRRLGTVGPLWKNQRFVTLRATVSSTTDEKSTR